MSRRQHKRSPICGVFAGKSINFRSKFELSIARVLFSKNYVWGYECETISYKKFLPNARCEECGYGQVYSYHTYTPDFVVSCDLESKIYLEVKGRFTSRDRTKMRAVKESNPDLDIRIILGQDNWLTRKHKSKDSDWCKRHGFPFAIKELPGL